VSDRNTSGMSSTGGAQLLERRPADTAQRPGEKSFVAWSPGENIDVRDWVRAGKRLGAMTRCSQWWLGDWVRYGTGRWGQKYRAAARISGYDVKTLRNFAYVAEQIDVSRRRDTLTWSHHAEVCGLDPPEQDRWLDLASSQGMSVADLRVALRSARREKDPAKHSKPDAVTVSCPECKHQFEVPIKGLAG
jgi:hypothetical protein